MIFWIEYEKHLNGLNNDSSNGGGGSYCYDDQQRHGERKMLLAGTYRMIDIAASLSRNIHSAKTITIMHLCYYFHSYNNI